jgi:hypothetical protein
MRGIENFMSETTEKTGYVSAELTADEDKVLSDLVEATRVATSMPKIGRSTVLKALLLEYAPIKIQKLNSKSQ